MNIGKSIKMALVKADKKQTWLADQLGVSARWVNGLANSVGASSATIERLAAVFDMKPSEFVALGED